MEQSAYEVHPIWDQLTATDEQLRQTEEWADQSAYTLAASRWLANTLRSHQEPADAMPYSSQILDGLNGNMAQICVALVSTNSTRDLAQLQSQISYIDSAIHQVATLPPVANRDPARQSSRTFVEYRESVEEALTRLNTRATEIEALLDQRASETTEQGTEVEERLTLLKASIDQLQAKITQDETRLDTALTTTNDTFIQAQSTREGLFTEWLEQQDTEFESSLGDIKTQGQEKLTEIERLHEAVEKVSGKAAGAILARDYGAYSTREWVSGVIAYILGFVGLVALAAYLIHTVSSVSKDEQVSWQYVALKLGLSITALAASGVAFQFGSHALSRANTNKRVQLELATIGTFLADVNDEEAVQAAKVAFVNRMFGRAWEESQPARSDAVVNVSAFNKIMDAVSKLPIGK